MKSIRKALYGFTLIEMLIVIAIIGILVGLITPIVVIIRNNERVKATQMRLAGLKSALESYQSKFGDYPPSSLAVFGVNMPNDTNLGIESATACLASKVDGRSTLGKMSGQDGYFGNTDKDSAGRNVTKWFFDDNQLREVHDDWGNPFVYFHYRDYTKPDAFSKYKISGKVQTCIPQKDGTTGAFYGAHQFQIWSAGPDGVNENGEGDDVVDR